MKSFAFGHVTILVFSALAVFEFIANASAQDSQLSDQLAALRRQAEAAWNQRTNAIKSLSLKAECQEFRKGRGDVALEPKGPLRDGRPKEDRVFKIMLNYAYEQGKVAVTRSGPVIDGDDPEQTRQQNFHATFDGHLNASLLEEANRRMGSIEKKGVANGDITQGADFLAVNLWLQPQTVLHDVGWSFKNMSVEENAVDIDGIQCRRLRIPRGDSRWTSVIDCDAERGWIPVRWLTWHDGRISMKLNIRYDDDKRAEPMVREWAFTHYGKDGEIEQSRKAKVTQNEVNGDIDDNSFTIQFPIGTRVSEVIGGVGGKRRLFIQEAQGLVPMKESNNLRQKANGLGET